ncbi:MAG: SMI1/KNR4 family protein [Planctomycetaceae bacterium]
MSLVDIVKNAQTTTLLNEDGEEITLELLPPLSADEVEEFADTLPCPLPEDVRELLSYCGGFEGGVAERVDFTGAEMMFEHEILFPHGVPIASDGFGNFWVVDLTEHSTTFGPVYFACHDAPVILYQSDTLAEFLSELFRTHDNLVLEVPEDRLFDVWRTNPGMLTFDECAQSPDDALREFAAELDASWQVIDLRQAKPGFGFSWGP